MAAGFYLDVINCCIVVMAQSQRATGPSMLNPDDSPARLGPESEFLCTTLEAQDFLSILMAHGIKFEL